MATQETIKQLNVGGVLRDVEDVTARGLISSLQTALDALTSGDTTTAIESFNEIVAFLENVSDSSTLQGIIAGLNTSIAGKYTKPGTGIPASDLAQAVQAILDSVANKANSADVYTKSQTYDKDEVDTKVANAQGTQGPKGDTGNVEITDAGDLVTILVNDLTTGGAGNILSAEMGKRVAGREATDRQRIDAIVAILKKSVFTDDQSAAIAALDALANATDSVSLDKSSYLFNGISGTLTLTATTDPAGKSVTWSSSNPSVATVNNGVVTPIAEGNTIITATSGGKTATCMVTVSAFVVNSVTISGNDLNNGVLISNGETYGATHQLSAVTDPAGGNISWSSDNESVATVNNGIVTIVGNGTATITASSGGKSDSVTINVSNLLVNSLTLNKQSLSLFDVGETETIVATTNPAGAPVTWSSSDNSVATVNNGVVTSVGNGSCTITATCFGITATCSVNVQALPAGFQKNKAWTDASDATGSWGYDSIYNDSLTDAEGYCVTPIYTLMNGQSNPYYGKYGVKSKSGCINNDDSSPKLCNVIYSLDSDDIYGRHTIDSDPQYKTSSANVIRRISFTFKISELANCYVYDFVAGEYLFAGSNIDTSVAPSADNSIDNNLINS